MQSGIALAAVSRDELHRHNSARSAGVGLTFGLGQQNGISLQIGASQARGNAAGSSLRYDNTRLIAAKAIALESGGDTRLQGASARAPQALGLPAAQAARMLQNGVEYYAITPKAGAKPMVFVSDVAQTSQGVVRTVPNTTQVIVPNRAQWSDPKPVDPATLR